ncbi:hypothetical protein ACH5RR_010778 [Cinchona calisaya]|uniref:Uncharacterized protein n=1 Tax=Cinchona calisaya TaxID=153742 RepID=A0ABD3AK27_9GENT
MPKKKKPTNTNHHGKAAPQAPLQGKNKDLLEFEENSSYSNASIESKLLFCKKDYFLQPQIAKSGGVSMPDKKPDICAIPESNVLDKVKDFLGVISEANKRLQFDAKDNTEKYDIEVMNGSESEYIEMDLMLGVADLHTPEAVAAAESAMACYQPTVSLVAGSSGDDDDDDSSEDSNGEEKMSKAAGENENSSCEPLRNQPSKKRPKIIELS